MRIPIQDDEGRIKVKENARDEKDLEEYHNDLEENVDMRRDVNMYLKKNKTYKSAAKTATKGEFIIHCAYNFYIRLRFGFYFLA